MISFHSPSAVLVHSGVRALQRERRSSRLRSRTLVQLWGTLALTVTETHRAVQVGKQLTMCSTGGKTAWYILSWAVKVSTANLVTIDLTLLGLLSLILPQWQSMTTRSGRSAFKGSVTSTNHHVISIVTSKWYHSCTGVPRYLLCRWVVRRCQVKAEVEDWASQKTMFCFSQTGVGQRRAFLLKKF